MHAVMVARRSLLPWSVIRVKDSGMRAWQDMLMGSGAFSCRRAVALVLLCYIGEIIFLQLPLYLLSQLP